MEDDICGMTYFLLKTCEDKKLHDDLTKPCEMCKEGIRCERMDNYKGHSICVQRSLLLLLLLENQHLIVPSNKSFPKIHFLFVLSICLPPRLLSSLCSLIVIPYPYFYPYPNPYPGI